MTKLIRKTQQPSDYPSNQIHDAYSTSTTDTYTCNYINGIVESGSNANGSYTKFADGTMICNGKKEITTTRNTSYGSLYVSPKITAIQYPEAFTEVNSVILNAEASNNSAWLLSADLGTLTSTPTYYIAGATSAGTNTYYVNFQAIGKWK